MHFGLNVGANFALGQMVPAFPCLALGSDQHVDGFFCSFALGQMVPLHGSGERSAVGGFCIVCVCVCVCAHLLSTLLAQVAGPPLTTQPLEKVVLATWNGGKPTPAFKNAAQVGALLWHSGLYGERG